VKLIGVSECGDSGLKAARGYLLKDQIEIWRRILHGLGKEFVEGHATVSPTEWACQYCDLAGLCRIAERGEEAADG
jgi:hypothetical protein